MVTDCYWPIPTLPKIELKQFMVGFRVAGVKIWPRKMDTERIPERPKTLLPNKRILMLISGH